VKCLSVILLGTLTVEACSIYPHPPLPRPYDAGMRSGGSPAADAVETIEGVDGLRVRLAEALANDPRPVDIATFAQVCAPVRAEVRRIARERGWTIEQLAERYRVPAHAADPQAITILSWMEEHPELTGVWLRTSGGSKAGIRYLRRIDVGPACLRCHGAKEDRPAFVVERYPDDRAYGFRAGDLRGLYSVQIPGDGP
jgi:hypothetical protein